MNSELLTKTMIFLSLSSIYFLANIKQHVFSLYHVHKNHSEDTGRALISCFICNISSAPRSPPHHGYLRQIVLCKL